MTALRRNEPLESIPISLSVFQGEELDQWNIENIDDLDRLDTSLRIAQFSNSTNINFLIRGFGNGAFNSGIEPSVGIFVDGVYRSGASAAIADLPDVERVEILRGPQSSLFGKNSSVGVISIVTKEPSFAPSGHVKATIGTDNSHTTKIGLTGPVSETLAVRFGAGYRYQKGFGKLVNLDQNINNRNRWWARGQLLWQPHSQASLRLIADYDGLDEECCLVVNVEQGPSSAIIEQLGGRVAPDRDKSYVAFANQNSTNRIDNYGISINADVDMERLRIKSVTSLRFGRNHHDQDSDFSSADLLAKNIEGRRTRTFSQDLTLELSLRDRLKSLFGVFFLHQHIRQTGTISFGNDFRNYADALIRGATQNQLNAGFIEQAVNNSSENTALWSAGQGTDEKYRLNNSSISIFSQLKFDASERLSIFLSGSFTHDRKNSAIRIESTDQFSAVDLIELGRQLIISQAIGQSLDLGRVASPMEIAQFLTEYPQQYAALDAFARRNAALTPLESQTDDDPSTTVGNGLLALRELQFLPPFLDYPNEVETGKLRESFFSWSARGSYAVTEKFTLFAGYSKGFKASSINLSRDSRPPSSIFSPGSPSQIPLPEPSPIRNAGLALTNLTTGSRLAGPESVHLFEAGARLNARRAQFAVTMFRQEIDDFQAVLFLGSGFVLKNAGKQATNGVEIDVSFAPSTDLRLDAQLTYLDAHYEKFPDAPAAGGATLDLSGKRVPGIPKISANFGIAHCISLSSRTDLTISANVRIASSTKIRSDFPRIRRKVEIADLSARFETATGWDFALWIKNVLGSERLEQVFPGVLQPGTVSGYPGEPRHIAAAAIYSF